jgi:hypothetical protein
LDAEPLGTMLRGAYTVLGRGTYPMDTITDRNDLQPARTNDHLICNWFSVSNILPQLVGTPCQHCRLKDAVYWNHDDELGELLYCEDCMDEVYEPFVYEEIEPAPPELVSATLAFIVEHGTVTFHQLARFLSARGVRVDGNYAVIHPDDWGCWVWADASGEMMDLVSSLEDEGNIVYRPTSRQTYLDNGGVPDFAKPKLPDKWGMPWRDRWVPTVLALSPRATDAGASQQ